LGPLGVKTHLVFDRSHIVAARLNLYSKLLPGVSKLAPKHLLPSTLGRIISAARWKIHILLTSGFLALGMPNLLMEKKNLGCRIKHESCSELVEQQLLSAKHLH